MNAFVESVPAYWYFDSGIYAEEQEKIFRKNWIFICPEESIPNPGDFVVESIAGQSVVIVRESENTITGFLNLCRHRAAPVCATPKGNLQQFTCPYHAWTYNLSGSLMHAPGFDESLNKECHGLISARVECWNNLIFACLDKNASSLIEWLGEIPEMARSFPSVSEMEFDSVHVNECSANWKNYSDNSAEGYHLSSVHRDLNRSLVRRKTKIECFENGQFVGFSVFYKNESNEELPGFWVYKFPGMLIHFSSTDFNIERVTPLDARNSLMQRWFWFKPEISSKVRKKTVDFSTQIMKEDISICTLVQKNLEGGIYEKGILSPEREPGTIYFQKCVTNALKY